MAQAAAGTNAGSAGSGKVGWLAWHSLRCEFRAGNAMLAGKTEILTVKYKCCKGGCPVKTAVGVAACIAAVIFIAGIAWMDNPTIGMIGGADGPTAIFVAGKWPTLLIGGLVAIGIVLAATAIVFYLKRKR